MTGANFHGLGVSVTSDHFAADGAMLTSMGLRKVLRQCPVSPSNHIKWLVPINSRKPMSSLPFSLLDRDAAK